MLSGLACRINRHRYERVFFKQYSKVVDDKRSPPGMHSGARMRVYCECRNCGKTALAGMTRESIEDVEEYLERLFENVNTPTKRVHWKRIIKRMDLSDDEESLERTEEYLSSK